MMRKAFPAVDADTVVSIAILATTLVGTVHRRAPFEPQHQILADKISPLARAMIERGRTLEPNHGLGPARTRPHQTSECSLALAISGGGTVSAAFAFGALERIGERFVAMSMLPPGDRPSILNEIDYLSTASGGGIVAMLFLEMLREDRARSHSDFLSEREAAASFDSARYRGSLDWGFLSEGHFVRGLLMGTNPARVYERMEQALVGFENDYCSCTDPLSVCRARPERERDRPGCRFRVPGEAVLGRPVQSDFALERFPLWIPNATINGAGTNLPLTREWLDELRIEKIVLADGYAIPREEFNLHHALMISMAFPGIGPVEAVSSAGFSLKLVDGGQSDNLGVENAAALVLADVAGGRARKGLVISIDSSLTAPMRGLGPNEVLGFQTRFTDALFNGDPLLQHWRTAAPVIVHGTVFERERSDPAHGALQVDLAQVRMSELLDDPAEVEWEEVNGCVTNDTRRDPKDYRDCAKQPSSNRQSVFDRLRSFSTSLSLSRQQAEDLIQAGRRAVDAAGHLEEALRRCVPESSTREPDPARDGR